MAQTFTCPNCGTDVNVRAKSCPECGADDQTVWKERDYSHTAEDDEFDYDEFLQKEFGKPGLKPKGMSWWTWALAIVLIIALLFLFLR